MTILNTRAYLYLCNERDVLLTEDMYCNIQKKIIKTLLIDPTSCNLLINCRQCSSSYYMTFEWVDRI